MVEIVKQLEKEYQVGIPTLPDLFELPKSGKHRHLVPSSPPRVIYRFIPDMTDQDKGLFSLKRMDVAPAK